MADRNLSDVQIMKGSKWPVLIEDASEDILAVCLKSESKCFRGILLDTSKRGIPYGIYPQKPPVELIIAAKSPTTGLSPEQRGDRTPHEGWKSPRQDVSCLALRHTYRQDLAQLDDRLAAFVNKPFLPPLRAKTVRNIRLRPRQVLCSRCQCTLYSGKNNKENSRRLPTTSVSTCSSVIKPTITSSAIRPAKVIPPYEPPVTRKAATRMQVLPPPPAPPPQQQQQQRKSMPVTTPICSTSPIMTRLKIKTMPPTKPGHLQKRVAKKKRGKGTSVNKTTEMEPSNIIEIDSSKSVSLQGNQDETNYESTPDYPKLLSNVSVDLSQSRVVLNSKHQNPPVPPLQSNVLKLPSSECVPNGILDTIIYSANQSSSTGSAVQITQANHIPKSSPIIKISIGEGTVLKIPPRLHENSDVDRESEIDDDTDVSHSGHDTEDDNVHSNVDYNDEPAELLKTDTKSDNESSKDKFSDNCSSESRSSVTAVSLDRVSHRKRKKLLKKSKEKYRSQVKVSDELLERHHRHKKKRKHKHNHETCYEEPLYKARSSLISPETLQTTDGVGASNHDHNVSCTYTQAKSDRLNRDMQVTSKSAEMESRPRLLYTVCRQGDGHSVFEPKPENNLNNVNSNADTGNENLDNSDFVDQIDQLEDFDPLDEIGDVDDNEYANMVGHVTEEKVSDDLEQLPYQYPYDAANEALFNHANNLLISLRSSPAYDCNNTWSSTQNISPTVRNAPILHFESELISASSPAQFQDNPWQPHYSPISSCSEAQDPDDLEPDMPEEHLAERQINEYNSDDDINNLDQGVKDSVENIKPLMMRIQTCNVQRCFTTDGRLLRVDDIIWGKVKGFPWWPGHILSVDISQKDNGIVIRQMAQVSWFNSSTMSHMLCDNLYPFLEDFKLRYNRKRRGSYRLAVKQATAAAQARMGAHHISLDDEIELYQEPVWHEQESSITLFTDSIPVDCRVRIMDMLSHDVRLDTMKAESVIPVVNNG